ncbi:MAG: single-stranded DNA-binding protein [Lentisphaeria bacterium]|nr:single-stranded DNA-binding protein [Lentisphaeria bacterium]
MPSVNKVILIGNLTREPELRQMGGGGMLASFTLAMSRKYTNNRQELVEEPCFVDVTAFQRNAEVIRDYVHKGDPLFVEGRLRYDTWDDRTTGTKRSKLTVVCEALQLLSRRGENAPVMPASAPAAYRQPSQYARPAYAAAPAAPQYGAPQAAPQYQQNAPAAPMVNYDQQVPQSQFGANEPMPSFQTSGMAQDAPSAPQDAPMDDVPF